MPGAAVVSGRDAELRDRGVPARDRRASRARGGRRGRFDGVVVGSACGRRPRRSRTICAGSASSRATGSSDTCRTSAKRSSRSSARPASARPGRCATRTSPSTAWSRGSGSSNRRCWWPATDRCTAGSVTTGSAELAEIRAQLPTLKATVLVPRLGTEPPADVTPWSQVLELDAPLEITPVPFAPSAVGAVLVRAPPARRRASCTATAAWCSNTSNT